MTPSTLWHRWSLDPLVLGGIAVAAVAYAHGVSALWRSGERSAVGRGVASWQAGCFVGGLLALAAALVSPLDPLAHALLSAHMAQHFLLIMVAAPLLVLGSPGIAFAAAVP